MIEISWYEVHIAVEANTSSGALHIWIDAPGYSEVFSTSAAPNMIFFCVQLTLELE